jgi:hypothetical protein
MSDSHARFTVSLDPDVARLMRFYQIALGVSLSSLVEVACSKLLQELPSPDDVSEVAKSSHIPYMGATRSVEVARDRLAVLKQGALGLE